MGLEEEQEQYEDKGQLDKEQTLEPSDNFQDDNNDINIEDEKTDINLTFPLTIDPDDYHETILDDTINDKMHSPITEWPNETYYEFMEIVTEY